MLLHRLPPSFLETYNLFLSSLRRKIIILLFREFCTPAVTDGFRLVYEWQQVSTSLQDSSRYSGQSQQSYSLDGIQTSSYFQFVQSLYQSFGNCTDRTNYLRNHRHFLVPHSFFFFCSLSRYWNLSLFSLSFGFTLWLAGMAKFTIRQVLFFLWLSLGLVVLAELDFRLFLKISANLVSLIILGRFWVVHIPFVRMVKFKIIARFPFDHLLHSFVSSIILFFMQAYWHSLMWLIDSLIYFPYYVIDR